MPNTTTLADLARQIDDGKDLLPSDFHTFCGLINATGPQNQHLRFTPEPRRCDRSNPVDIYSSVYGDFLTVLYDSHWPRLVLAEHKDRTEMAEYVVDNVCLGHEVFAFENSKRLRYRMIYDDANGPRSAFRPNLPTASVHWIDT